MTKGDVSLIVFGGIAGATGKTSAAPVERLKVLFQVGGGTNKPKSMAAAFRTIVQTEGVKGLWKGNMVNCLRIFPHRGVLFSCNDLYRKKLGDLGVEKRYLGFVTGSLAGMTATMATYPMDLVRTQRAGHYGVESLGMCGMLKHNYQTAGIRGLYRGIGVTLLTALPYEGLKFGLYPLLKEKLPAQLMGINTRDDSGKLKTLSMVLCGGTAGCIAGTITYSNDTARRILQIAGRPGGSENYPRLVSATEAYKYIYRTGGVRGFYAGLWPNLIRMIPNIGVEFAIFESLKRNVLEE